jgi:hypothetical protein
MAEIVRLRAWRSAAWKRIRRKPKSSTGPAAGLR